MPEYVRYLGIDVGSKRIGLARTDLLRTIASPIGTFRRPEVFEEIARLVEHERVQKFVVGWPLTPKGLEGEATKMVDKFIKELARRFPEVSVVKVDERYTSKQAVQAMVDAGVPKMKRRERGRIDKAAAAIILQNYLDQTAD